MESEILKIIILAIIQGVTEFLPISSSGHLVIFQNFLDLQGDNLYYAIILHAGTLLSIVVYYYRDILALVKSKNFKVFGLIFYGTIPLVFIGLVMKPIIETHFGSLRVVMIGLICTSLMLLLLHLPKSGNRTLDDLSWYEGILVGLFQCIAIIPGISRSGSTISIASRLGVEHESAAKYSFFLGIVAISGATVLELKDVFDQRLLGLQDADVSFVLSIIGFTVSFGVGYISLFLLIHMLKNKTFSYFGYYCLSVSILLFIYDFYFS